MTATLDKRLKEMQDLGRASGHPGVNTPLALLGLCFFHRRLGTGPAPDTLSTSAEVLRLARDIELRLGWNGQPFSRYLLSDLPSLDQTTVGKWLASAQGVGMEAGFEGWFLGQLESLMLPTFQETPRAVAQMIVSLFDEEPALRVLDPACGTGGLLSAAWQRFGPGRSALVGKEGNGYAYAWATVRLAVQGAWDVRIELDQALRAGDDVMNGERQRADIVLTNPPFGLQVPVADLPPSIRGSALFAGQQPARVSSETAHVLMAYESLSGKGAAAIIVPNGFLVRGGADQRIREALVEQGAVGAVIGLPARLFAPATAIETSILVLRGPGKRSGEQGTLFIDARGLGHRRGPKAVLDETAVDRILATFNACRSERGFSEIVGKSKLQAAGCSLVPSAYVEHVALERIDAPDRRAKINDLDERYASLLAEYEVLRSQLMPG